MSNIPTDRRLTKAERSHLEFALDQVRRSGSYYGSRSQFLKRQSRLEQWLTGQQRGSHALEA